MSSNNFKITTITSVDKFSEIRDSWNELLSSSSSDNVFLTWEFCFTWWEAFKENRELFIVVVYDGDKLVGIAPLYRAYVRQFGIFKRYHLELIGGTETFFEGLDLIISPENESKLLELLVDYIYSKKVLHWDVLNITALRETSKIFPKLISYLNSKNYKHEVYSVRDCVVINFSDTFLEYLSTLGKSTRQSLKNHKNKLFKLPDVHFEYVNSAPLLEESYSNFMQLHQMRQNAKGNDGSFRKDRRNYNIFHKNLIKLLGTLEWANISFIRVGDTYISGRYDFLYHETLYAYSIGFDPDWFDYSPGNVLSFVLYDHLITNSSVKKCDLLRGVSSHKLQWTKNIEKSCDLAIWRSSTTFIKAKYEQKLRTAIKLLLPEGLVHRIYSRFLSRGNS